MDSRPTILLVLCLAPVGARAALATPPASAAPRSRGGAGAAVTVIDLLREEQETLQSMLTAREELRRVRLGRRVATGELQRLESVHLEVSRRRKGVEKSLAERAAQLKLRVRALVRLVRRTARRPLLDPRRARASGDGRGALLRILRRDLEELRRIRSEGERLGKALADVQRRRREAVAVLRDLDRRRDLLQAKLASGRQQLAGLRHRRQNHRGLASEWNQEAYRVERELVALHLQLNRAAPSFAKQRGSLVRPVPGLIVSWFGERRVVGTKVSEEPRGVEISALPAWKVRAPADGTVRYAGPVPGFGNVVVTDHGEGYLSVVGHLGPILVKVGDTVRSGRPIATLPASRDPRGLRVYLELRRAGRPFDPVPWLHGGLAERARRGPTGPGEKRRPGAPPPRSDAVVEKE